MTMEDILPSRPSLCGKKPEPGRDLRGVKGRDIFEFSMPLLKSEMAMNKAELACRLRSLARRLPLNPKLGWTKLSWSSARKHLRSESSASWLRCPRTR
jgi:hypothetical protein